MSWEDDFVPFLGRPEMAADATIRDYFAAKAMQSIPLALDGQEQQLIATAAYRMADAMIKAREVT